LAEGGQANVLKGSILGIFPPLLRKGWDSISSKLGLFEGSRTKIFRIKSFDDSDIYT
jgi:hypothetical protein